MPVLFCLSPITAAVLALLSGPVSQANSLSQELCVSNNENTHHNSGFLQLLPNVPLPCMAKPPTYMSCLFFLTSKQYILSFTNMIFLFCSFSFIFVLNFILLHVNVGILHNF
jgi:hypothetical protein